MAPDKNDGAWINLADLLHQRERAQHAGMAARARAYRDDAVDALCRGLLGVPQIDDVMKYDAAITVHRATTSAGGRRLVMTIGTRCLTHKPTSCSSRSLLACTIWFTANGATWDPGMRAPEFGQLSGDLGQPFIELRGRPGIQRRK